MVLLGTACNTAGGCVAAVNDYWLLAALAFFVAGCGLVALAVLMVLGRHH